MKKLTNLSKNRLYLIIVLISISGCAQNMGARIQWDSKDQILLSEESQVKLRSVQTQVFDTTDKESILKAAIYAMQDLFFDIDVVDPSLGILSGKKLYANAHAWRDDATYFNYKTDDLIIFASNYRTFGPFKYRSDLTRLTITVRPRGETQLIVRASVQYDIDAVDSPEVYQKFFALLRQSLFILLEIN
ncbi:MAG TPA: hypothetical protein EYP92_03815 [Candidatus Thioglobus sp.]|jgi:SHS2 domain-containing protein|nr:hypothetical protein [Candidatus Thioglobus sp.]HIK77395.1 hypothetical protein [Gammaproteobacteria bacterium]